LPLFGPISLSEGLRTLQKGTHYILPQIAGAIITQGPMVFLGTRSNPLNAATFSILTRISAPFQQLQQMFLVQVWPAITEALHRGDLDWLRKTLRRVLRINLVFGVAVAMVVVFAVTTLFPLLTKEASIKPTFVVVVVYAVHIGIMCVAQGLAYMANGLSLTRLQNYIAIFSMIFALVVLPIAAGRFGTQGVLMAMIGLNGLVTLPLLFWEYTLFLRRTKSGVGAPF